MYHIFSMSQLLLNGSGFGLSIVIRVGNLKLFPNIIQFPGCKDFIFSILFSSISVMKLRMKFKSFGWNILNTIKLLHCDIVVSDISDGLCEINPSNIPNFLPSLVILSNILYPSIFVSISFWIYLCASSRIIWNGIDALFSIVVM